MKALKIFGICLSVIAFALVLSIMGSVIVTVSHYSYIPHKCDVVPNSSFLFDMKELFFFPWFFIHILVFVQALYLMLKLFIKRMPYKLVMYSFIATVIVIILFRYTALHYFVGWVVG